MAELDKRAVDYFVSNILPLMAPSNISYVDNKNDSTSEILLYDYPIFLKSFNVKNTRNGLPREVVKSEYKEWLLEKDTRMSIVSELLNEIGMLSSVENGDYTNVQEWLWQAIRPSEISVIAPHPLWLTICGDIGIYLGEQAIADSKSPADSWKLLNWGSAKRGGYQYPVVVDNEKNIVGEPILMLTNFAIRANADHIEGLGNQPDTRGKRIIQDQWTSMRSGINTPEAHQ